MASCHQITYVYGELVGDPLDVRMFEATHWQLREDAASLKGNGEEVPLQKINPVVYDEEQATGKHNQVVPDSSRGHHQASQDFISILRRFDFDSKLQRMSVISRNHLDTQSPYNFFVKGSPEKIKELSIKSSLPDDFDSQLEEYTQRGYRVIALAYRAAPKNLSYQQLMVINRDDVEKDVIFLGFLIMHNKLKSATNKALKELNDADIRTIMATGDNMLTALSVGRKCGIINES